MSCVVALLALISGLGFAQETSRYMGGAVELVEAPNGAVVDADLLEVNPRIMVLEPTVEEVIEGENGLILYDTGDTREEAEHIREAVEKISDKPIKVILYSHSHYALGGGALVDDPDDVLVIGQPTRKSGRRTGSLSCER